MVNNSEQDLTTSQRNQTESREKSYYNSLQNKMIRINHNTVVPVAAGAFQIFTGLILVGISILGLLTPVWFSAVMSLIGSITSMAGVYLIYHTLSDSPMFDNLVNSAIKRVVNSQN